ncbi:MAG TPA: hypothetical protein VHD63_01230 [Ktedonobacteraceae bacterium]|jgi:hypothetical protein|nr:hypothetical protein [Ktedonobacteraceae bacterium]
MGIFDTKRNILALLESGWIIELRAKVVRQMYRGYLQPARIRYNVRQAQP